MRGLLLGDQAAFTECTYWAKLEYRLCREFAGLPTRRHRYFWCDGLDPTMYDFESTPPRIRGRACICNGDHAMEWMFTLLLPASCTQRDLIDWPSLLPADDASYWMSFDESLKTLEMEPAAARPPNEAS